MPTAAQAIEAALPPRPELPEQEARRAMPLQDVLSWIEANGPTYLRWKHEDSRGWTPTAGVPQGTTFRFSDEPDSIVLVGPRYVLGTDQYEGVRHLAACFGLVIRKIESPQPNGRETAYILGKRLFA